MEMETTVSQPSGRRFSMYFPRLVNILPPVDTGRPRANTANTAITTFRWNAVDEHLQGRLLLRWPKNLPGTPVHDVVNRVIAAFWLGG
jgi:hypothetical protein